MTITFDEDKQKQKLNTLLHKEEEDLVQILAGKYGVEYVSLQGQPINTDALRLIEEPAARELQVAAFALIDKRVKIAARNPQDPKLQELLASLKTKGFNPEV